MPYFTAARTKEQNPPLLAWCGVGVLFFGTVVEAIRGNAQFIGIAIISIFTILGYVIPTSEAIKWMSEQEKVRDEIDLQRLSFKSESNLERAFIDLKNRIEKAEREHLIYVNLATEWRSRNIPWWRKVFLKETKDSNSPWQMEYENSYRLVEGLKNLLQEMTKIYPGFPVM